MNIYSKSKLSGRTNSPSFLVITPTYNEAECIRHHLDALKKLNLDVLIVDDSSDDGTLEILNEEKRTYKSLSVLVRPKKMGLGTAYVEGFKWGLQHGYSHLIQMDADGSHRSADLTTLINAVESDPLLQMCIGSRWVAGGEIENWSKGREWLSRSGNRYVKFMLNIPVKDSTAGFRIYTSDILQKIDLGSISSEGYSFQIEMTKKILELDSNWLEIPIKFVERRNGKSKMSRRIVFEALYQVGKWKFKKGLKR